jgi:hypothetical protein
LLATEVLKASSSKLEMMMENASSFMGKFIPRLSFSPDNQQEVSLSLDWKEVKKQPDDILNMAEKIAMPKTTGNLLYVSMSFKTSQLSITSLHSRKNSGLTGKSISMSPIVCMAVNVIC